MNGGMTKCPVVGCKSYFECREDMEEHLSHQHGHQPGRGITRPQPEGREEVLPSAFKGLSTGVGTTADARRTSATTPSRAATRADSDVPTAGGISVAGNTGTLVFFGGSKTSKSGGVSVTGNKGSQVFCGPSGNSSTSGASQSKPGGFTVIGNKGVQLCFTSARSSSTSSASQSQSGFIVISDNENVQLLSDGSKGDDVNICKNKDTQLLHGSSTPGAEACDVNVKDNENSLVFIPQLGGGEAASEIQRDDAEGAPESVTPEFAQDY